MKISIVGGGGRVGLPLAISLAHKNHEIIIIDSDPIRVKQINQREMPFYEKDADYLLKNLGINQLKATFDNHEIIDSDVCILIIGTPINEDGTPGANELSKVVQSLSRFLVNTKLLMLRSTVYPGITEKISLEVKSYGLNTFVSFCPERITEGNALEEIRILPQIIGADSEPSYLISEKVFNGVSPKCIRTTFKEAEISKLFANAFRYFKFAIANEFFELCVNENINWENVWYSLKEEYPRAKDLPLPGFAAGPCLVKDTLQLDYFAENKFNISKAAIKVNEEMPDFIIEQLQKNYDLSNMIVGILGMTFKANVDDFRSSLSFRLKNLLQNVAKEVLCSDEVLQKDYFITSNELLAKSDIVIIATPHKEYSKLSIDKPLVDIWRINSSVSIF